MLDPRAIATLGLGYGPALSARLGLWPSAIRPSTGGLSQSPRHSDRISRSHEADTAISLRAAISRGLRRDDEEVLSMLALVLGRIL